MREGVPTTRWPLVLEPQTLRIQGLGQRWETAGKPGSVVDSHSSSRVIAHTVKRPTRFQRGSRLNGTLFGLAPGGVCHANSVTRVAVRSYRTVSPLPDGCPSGGLFSVALSVGSRRPAVNWHLTLWSPDFPPLASKRRLSS